MTRNGNEVERGSLYFFLLMEINGTSPLLQTLTFWRGIVALLMRSNDSHSRVDFDELSMRRSKLIRQVGTAIGDWVWFFRFDALTHRDEWKNHFFPHGSKWPSVATKGGWISKVHCCKSPLKFIRRLEKAKKSFGDNFFCTWVKMTQCVDEGWMDFKNPLL